MKRNLALFDFDGTITTKDTFIEFIKFYKGNDKFLAGFLLLSPILILFKLKIFPNWKAKEVVLKHFFKGEDLATFNSKAASFIDVKIESMLKPEALAKFKEHLKNGDEVVVVSASAVNWVKPWTKRYNVELLATRLEVSEGQLTGKIDGYNCYGPEKVNRVKQNYDLSDYQEIYAYGDSRGDREMLSIATKPFYRKFSTAD